MSRASHARLRRRLIRRMGPTLVYARAIGWRDAAAAVDAIGRQMHRGRTYCVDIGHTDDCPCAHGTEPLERCVCPRVELHVFEARA